MRLGAGKTAPAAPAVGAAGYGEEMGGILDTPTAAIAIATEAPPPESPPASPEFAHPGVEGGRGRGRVGSERRSALGESSVWRLWGATPGELDGEVGRKRVAAVSAVLCIAVLAILGPLVACDRPESAANVARLVLASLAGAVCVIVLFAPCAPRPHALWAAWSAACALTTGACFAAAFSTPAQGFSMAPVLLAALGAVGVAATRTCGAEGGAAGCGAADGRTRYFVRAAQVLWRASGTREARRRGVCGDGRACCA
jgi:hypothetical protein